MCVYSENILKTSSSHQPPASPGNAPDFEQAIAQLEEIIERIESGQVGLEKSISEYERGVGLIRRCREVLERAEQRVEELSAQMQADRAAGAAGGGSGTGGKDASQDEDSKDGTPF